MAERLVVGLVATPQPWRQALEFFVADHIGALRLVALHEPSDAFDDVDVVVVDDTLAFVTPAQVLELHDRGVRVVGVYDPEGRRGRGRRALDDLGVDAVIPLPAPPEEIVDIVARLAPARARSASPRQLSNRNGTAAHQGNAGRGLVVAVGGGSDSPGRTETAIALVSNLARRGASVLLVDLDDHNPSLARRLGFPLVPNVLDALAAVTAGQPPEEAIAQRHTNAVGEVAFHAITGLAHPSDWARLRDLPTLLTQAANRWHYVVIDTGPSCAADQTPPGSNRHATTRTAITAADHVIAVGNGTRSGVLRLLDWASSAAELVSQRSVLVAVNRAPRDRYRRDQIQDQLHTHLGEGLVRTIEYLPFDPAVFRADWDAAVPTRGPFVDGIDTLAHRLRPAPTRHSSRRRLIGASR